MLNVAFTYVCAFLFCCSHVIVRCHLLDGLQILPELFLLRLCAKIFCPNQRQLQVQVVLLLINVLVIIVDHCNIGNIFIDRMPSVVIVLLWEMELFWKQLLSMMETLQIADWIFLNLIHFTSSEHCPSEISRSRSECFQYQHPPLMSSCGNYFMFYRQWCTE